MFCKKCGKYNLDHAKTCIYCGHPVLVKNLNEAPNPEYASSCNISKTGVGILMALFLGIIGLIIGLLLYPSGSYERETFISGWVKTFIVTVIISVVLVICLTSCATCALMFY